MWLEPSLPVNFARVDSGTVLAAIAFVVQSKGPVMLVAEQCVSNDNTLEVWNVVRDLQKNYTSERV